MNSIVNTKILAEIERQWKKPRTGGIPGSVKITSRDAPDSKVLPKRSDAKHERMPWTSLKII